MSTLKDRRRSERWPVRLLVKCVFPDKRARAGSEMWVKDVSDRGLCLELAAPKPARANGNGHAKPAPAPRRGQRVAVEELYYDEHGPHGRRGRVCWAAPGQNGAGLRLGIQFTDRPSASGRRTLAAFQDFLHVVKSAMT